MSTNALQEERMSVESGSGFGVRTVEDLQNRLSILGYEVEQRVRIDNMSQLYSATSDTECRVSHLEHEIASLKQDMSNLIQFVIDLKSKDSHENLQAELMELLGYQYFS